LGCGLLTTLWGCIILQPNKRMSHLFIIEEFFLFVTELKKQTGKRL